MPLPSQTSHIWDVFSNSVGTKKPNKLFAALSVTGQKLKHISTDPAISVTSLDVLFTVISLLTWTFTRDLDVDAILENSILSFLVTKHEKHVAFKDQLAKVQEHLPEPIATETTTPKKRGRKPKNATAVNGTSAAPAPPAASTGSVRRSSRKKTQSVDLDSDADSTYQPNEKTKQAVAHIESDGVTTAEDLASASESTALALFLAFAGGLGQLAAGVLGAEVSGPRDA
ncbi:hypothetical protein N0V83_003632 [Neocucurbitaria cava]|uniref:Uncharacterized protein n=1 Tax=Neocucurbitaria cava TaxID=798079 RepID=A0A9W8YBH4_9PLEO|nr:hypothetical protein N0V83_003632 [Neocucurbitaria cava]